MSRFRNVERASLGGGSAAHGEGLGQQNGLHSITGKFWRLELGKGAVKVKLG